MFRLMLRRRFKKTMKKKNLRRRVVKMILAPTAVLFAVLFMFFWSDDFWMYVQLQLFNAPDPYTDPNDQYEDDYWTGDDGFVEGSTSGDGGPIGSTGVAMMLTNQMASGYTRDWLEIARDHCNWKYMPDAVSPPKNGDTPMYPSVVLAIGTSLAETGIVSDYIPRTALDPAKYGSHNGLYTLRLANSSLIKQWGEDELYIMCGLDMSYSGVAGRRPTSGKSYRSQFQINHAYASVYPTYSTGSGTLYPSKMNGYNVSSGTVRKISETDMAYFPDQIAMMLQCGWTGSRKNVIWSNTTANNVANVTYSAYNGGWGVIINTWAIGDSPSPSKPFSDFNTVSRKTLGTEAINDISSLIDVAYKYFEQYDVSESDFNFRNHSDYGGLSALMTLTKGKGFFVNQTCLDAFKRNYTNAGFKRGALIGYRAGTGKLDATQADVDAFVNSLRVQSIDPEYGWIYSGKNSNDYIICYYDDAYSVYYKNGGNLLKALHAINAESVRGCYMTRIGGPYIYWKMLLNAGVECTLADATKDISGSFIDEAYNAYPGTKINNSTISHAAISFAYPTRDAGVGNNGTTLYQELHKAILPGDKYFMSCDRCVCVAVRWSGSDDGYPAGSCRSQLPYLILSKKWEEVDWGGDMKNLLPGDILIRSDIYDKGVDGVGHTLIYTGNALIKSFYPESPSSYVQVSASYQERSPGCGTWYSGVKDGYQTYRAFRNIRMESKSRYKNIEVTY